MAFEDRARAQWACRQVEAELTRLGGVELLTDARAEALWFADLYLPWDGVGAEPIDRLLARLDILATRLERARGARGDLA